MNRRLKDLILDAKQAGWELQRQGQKAMFCHRDGRRQPAHWVDHNNRDIGPGYVAKIRKQLEIA